MGRSRLPRRMFMPTVLALSFLALSFAGAARAATVAAFTQTAFAAAKRHHRPILVHVTAPWCPTCAAQRPILARLEARPEFRDLIVFNVDFDTRKDVVRELHVRMQSTLIAFRGTKELGRSVGDTNPASLKALLETTVH